MAGGGGGGKGGGGGGGGTSLNVTVGGTTEVDSDVEILGLDNIKTDNTHRLVLSTPEPLKSEFAITEPIVTDSKGTLVAESTGKLDLDTSSALTLDVRPLVSDACVKLELGPLPPSVCQPYESHFGMTFFGIEIFGFTARGESALTVEDRVATPALFTDHKPDRAPKSTARGDVVRIRLGG